MHTHSREREKGVMMMSECLLPNWRRNLKQQQRQEQVLEGELEGSTSSHSHVHNSNANNHQNPLLVPMSNHEVAELTWENGQLSVRGLSGLQSTSQPRPTWNRAHDTLESIVEQATYQNQKPSFATAREDHVPNRMSSIVASSGEKRGEDSGQLQTVPAPMRKRARSSNSDCCGRNFGIGTDMLEECDLPSGCASAGAPFCRDNDTTMMTWASIESGLSLKNKALEEDSDSHSGSEIPDIQDEDKDTKTETRHSNSTRRNRIAANHNQSERRRRDRINEKMKALQRLVPNSSKTDKASMLEEVIDYLKQLQAQIQMMSMRSMPQMQMMMMPLAMQQHQQLQMSSMLAQMGGVGLGMGMVNLNNMNGATPRSFPQLDIQPTPVAVGAPATAPIFVGPHSFMMPSLIQPHAPPVPLKPEPSMSAGTNASVTLPDPYSSILTQSMNMDLLNYNMAALYRQQMSQKNQGLSSPSQPHHGQGH